MCFNWVRSGILAVCLTVFNFCFLCLVDLHGHHGLSRLFGCFCVLLLGVQKKKNYFYSSEFLFPGFSMSSKVCKGI